jgi:glycogen debranching enzyme
MDNSPRWDNVMKNIILTHPLVYKVLKPIVDKAEVMGNRIFAVRPTYQREDNRHVSTKERPSKADYDRFVYLMDKARDLEYSQEEILKNSPFVIQDVLVNSILFRADDCLRDLAISIGESETEIDDWMANARSAFSNKLWNDKDLMYYDYDVVGDQQIREKTIASFMPLFAGIVDNERGRLLIEKHLASETEYSPDIKRSKYRFPTVSKKSRFYDSRRYWRGPIWANINWLMIQGLRRYKYNSLAHSIKIDTLDLISKSGFSEYFNPKTGDGYGTQEFSWTAAVAIDLLLDPSSDLEF